MMQQKRDCPRTIAGCLLIGVLAILAHGAPLAGEEGEAGPDMQAMMEAYMKAAEPGEHHKHLDRLAGSWDFESEVWSPAGGEPTQSAGTIESSWLLGGRFLATEVTGSFMDMPFEGMGIDGYDNGAKHYVATWIDTMGTLIAHYEGTCENGGKVRTMHTEVLDPLTGEMIKGKSVTTVLNDNSYMYEAFMIGADGTEFKQMELLAKRRQ